MASRDANKVGRDDATCCEKCSASDKSKECYSQPTVVMECQASNCLTCCADVAKCDSCESGYQLDVSSGTCVKIMAKCMAGSLTQCDQCESGFHLETHCDTSDSLCGLTKCPRQDVCSACKTSNCMRCDVCMDTCQECEKGYHHNHETGACELCKPDNCGSCSEDSSKCSSCLDGFRLNWFEGTCEQCSAPNCKSCGSSLDTCESCLEGFVGEASSGQCIAPEISVPVGGGHCSVRVRDLIDPFTEEPAPTILPSTAAPVEECTTTFFEHARWIPDMVGGERTVVDDYEACRQRCQGVVDCEHFSFWPHDGGCHLSDADATFVTPDHFEGQAEKVVCVTHTASVNL